MTLFRWESRSWTGDMVFGLELLPQTSNDGIIEGHFPPNTPQDWRSLQPRPKSSRTPDSCTPECRVPTQQVQSENWANAHLLYSILGTTNPRELSSILVPKHNWAPKGGCLPAGSLPQLRGWKHAQAFTYGLWQWKRKQIPRKFNSL